MPAGRARWTGTELMAGDKFTDGSGTPAGWGGGISVDQFVANGLAAKTKFSSLELGVYTDWGGADVWARMIYKGAGQPVAP